ncbi:helix-turn-helix domain-containing protein [Cedecea sp. NFIX57]|uniref:helix-turn-helix domain-containing protein n=1 Tax=Cedecea sp. NFIX57 TaxID=1566286 RepID=UPI000A1CE075|nr:helix-turn-helix domain-containing protein [Cedecea sp. NFIX57]
METVAENEHPQVNVKELFIHREQQLAARERLNAGASISAVARELNTSRQTIMRLRDEVRKQALQVKAEASLSGNRPG